MPVDSQLFTNNATAYLAKDLAKDDLTLEVEEGLGDLYPVLDSAAQPNDYFVVALENVAGDYEIVKVTHREGDVFTITRGWEDTTPQEFLVESPSRVELRLTAGTLTRLQYTGGLEDVPLDGKPYNRQDGLWQEDTKTVGEAPEDGTRYVRRNTDWVAYGEQAQLFQSPDIPPSTETQMVAFRDVGGTKAADPQDELVHTGTRLKLGEHLIDAGSSTVLAITAFSSEAPV